MHLYLISFWIILVVGVSSFARSDCFLLHHYHLSRLELVLTRLEPPTLHVADMDLMTHQFDSITFQNNLSIHLPSCKLCRRGLFMFVTSPFSPSKPERDHKTRYANGNRDCNIDLIRSI